MSNASCPAGLVPFGPQYRASGLLLHITSLPSPYGIGDVGPAAFAMVDRLQAAGQVSAYRHYQGWQVGPRQTGAPWRRLTST